MPTWSTLAVLRAIDGHLPHELVGDTARLGAARLAQLLSRVAESYYWEFRFDEEPCVDFLALLGNPHTAASSLAKALPAHSDSAWTRTLRLLRAWADDEVCSKIPFTWLEFDDVAAASGSLPRPNPAFGLEPGYFLRHHGPPPERGTGDVLRLTERALVVLDVQRVSSMLRSIERVAQALPPGGSIICVTAMLARAPQVIKLYVSLPKGDLVPLLSRIGWGGHVGEVERVLKLGYEPIHGQAFVDLTLGPELAPSLGLAWSQFHANEMANFDPGWAWLIERLGPRSPKATCARLWPGMSEGRVEDWSTALLRWLDMKAVMSPGRETKLKGYLGFMPSLPMRLS